MSDAFFGNRDSALCELADSLRREIAICRKAPEQRQVSEAFLQEMIKTHDTLRRFYYSLYRMGMVLDGTDTEVEYYEQLPIDTSHGVFDNPSEDEEWLEKDSDGGYKSGQLYWNPFLFGRGN